METDVNLYIMKIYVKIVLVVKLFVKKDTPEIVFTLKRENIASLDPTVSSSIVKVKKNHLMRIK